MSSIPTPPACALFQRPHKNENFACRNTMDGLLDCAKESCDSLHSSLSGGQVMDDSDRDGEIEERVGMGKV